MFGRRKKQASDAANAPARSPERWGLSESLLQLSDRDTWTIGNSFEGTQIFGAVGSGKTSGSGAAIAKAMLRAGYGGLVLTVKGDEPDLWKRYCAETGRSGSLVMFGPGHGHAFNFLEYERRRPGGGSVKNIAQLLQTVQRESQRSSGGKEDPFWQNAVEMILENAIGLLCLAGETLSVPAIEKVIRTAPKHPGEIDDPETRWHDDSYCAACLRSARDRDPTEGESPAERAATLDAVAAFWMEKFPTQPENTRGSALAMLDTLTGQFLTGPMRSLFCEGIGVVPEMTFGGAVIVIDLPLKTHHGLGRAVQILWKIMWQRAVENRDTAKDPRPVFFWADEAHNFYTAGDLSFQTTTRSARAASVLLTQSVSNYHAMMGGSGGGDAKATTDAYLGALQTMIFHANADPVTNQWAIDYFAKRWNWKSTRNKDKDGNDSSSMSPQMDPVMLAKYLQALRRGGEQDGHIVEAFISRSARPWKATDKPYLKVAFPQR